MGSSLVQAASKLKILEWWSYRHAPCLITLFCQPALAPLLHPAGSHVNEAEDDLELLPLLYLPPEYCCSRLCHCAQFCAVARD